MDMYARMNSSGVEDNYFHDSNQYKSARIFLEKCNLLHYLPVFIEEGFDSVEAINEITEEDLSEMGVKRGHRRVMQRAIATEKGIPSFQPLSYLVSNPSSSIRSDFGWERSTNENFISGNSTGSGTYSSGYGSMSSSQPNSTPLRYSHSQPINRSTVITDLPDSCHNDDAIIKEIANSSYSSNEEEEMMEEEDEDEEDEEEGPEEGQGEDDDDESSTIQRKYRRHPKRDKNAPIKPPSAYIMFSNHARAQLKDQNMSFVEIAKYVGDCWKNLDPYKKREYERNAMKEKDHYIDRLNAYRKTPEYKKYQAYLKDFKSKQDVMNRKIVRTRKLAKLESMNNANNTNNSNTSSNSNNNLSSNSADSFNDAETDETSLTTGEGGSSTSSGSIDIYKVHREKLKNKNNSNKNFDEHQQRDVFSPQPMNTDPLPNFIPINTEQQQPSPQPPSKRNLRSTALQ